MLPRSAAFRNGWGCGGLFLTRKGGVKQKTVTGHQDEDFSKSVPVIEIQVQFIFVFHQIVAKQNARPR